MRVRIWGSRGSIASPGPSTVRYGGNTSCVEVLTNDGTTIVLDIGTGARELGNRLIGRDGPIHVLITHLHMDHIQGAGFFAPLYESGREIHVWGPKSNHRTHRERLTKYLSSPLFPVHLDQFSCNLHTHDLADGHIQVGSASVLAQRVCHPGETFGFRIEADGQSVTYLPDHEPALAWDGHSPGGVSSGEELARHVDLLIHDCQYLDEDYPSRVGWGHTAVDHLVTFTNRVRPKVLMPFHFEPAYDDTVLDEMMRDLAARLDGFEVVPGVEGLEYCVGAPSAG